MKIYKYFFLFLISILLFACENVQKGLGMKKDVPDEFLIEKVDKIRIPPDYKLIEPGTIKKNTNNGNLDAKSILDESIKDTKLKNESTSEVNELDKSKSLEKNILDKIK